jgi:hypothetical protein
MLSYIFKKCPKYRFKFLKKGRPTLQPLPRYGTAYILIV